MYVPEVFVVQREYPPQEQRSRDEPPSSADILILHGSWSVFAKWDGCVELVDGEDPPEIADRIHICDLPEFIGGLRRVCAYGRSQGWENYAEEEVTP